MKTMHMVSFTLVIIGGLNWFLVGLFSWDVGMIFGGQEAIISKVIYVLVGLSTVYLATNHKKDCVYCKFSGFTLPSTDSPM